jgi:putative acetyltransferase
MNPRFKIGMRTIKTALAVGICLELFYLLNIGENINGVQAALAATICMKSSLQQTLKTGLDRTIGTIIGAVLGILFLMLQSLIQPELFVLVATAGVVVVIYLCNIFKLQMSVTISVVVYVSILVTQHTVTPLEYGVARLGETVFGIFVAFVINKFFDPKYIKAKIKAPHKEVIEHNLRGFTEGDTGKLMHIWLGVNISAQSFIGESYWHERYDSARETIKAAQTLVYDSNDGVLGFISVLDDRDIYGVYVKKEFQGGGIGTSLIAACQDKYPCLSVNVYKENERAVKFFLNRGFTITKESKKENGRSEYTMEWSTKSKAACSG